MILLELLKRMNKKIVIIIEGPEDAQVWTLTQLGIHDQIDFLAATNRFGIAKVDGLLEQMMKKLEVPATDLVYIGDNRERDIEPGLQATVFAIQSAENDSISLDETPTRVNTFHKIHFLVEDASVAED